jgi:hypothetical protein
MLDAYARLSPANRRRLLWRARLYHLKTQPRYIPLWGTLASWPILTILIILTLL